MSKTILPKHSTTAKSCNQCEVLILYLLNRLMVVDSKKFWAMGIARLCIAGLKNLDCAFKIKLDQALFFFLLILVNLFFKRFVLKICSYDWLQSKFCRSVPSVCTPTGSHRICCPSKQYSSTGQYATSLY